MKSINDSDEVEIDLREILAILLDRIVIILVIGVLCGTVAYAGTKLFIKPVYQSATQIYVKNNTTSDDKTTVQDLQSGSYLTKDFKILIKSRPILEQVISDLNLKMSTSELSSKISVATPQDTRVLTISVTDTDPWTAKNIADEVREAAKLKIQSVMGVETVNDIEDAGLPTSPISPNTKLYTIIGMLLGIIATIATIVIRYILDDTIKTQEDVEKYLSFSVLAAIPEMETDGKKKKKKKRA